MNVLTEEEARKKWCPEGFPKTIGCHASECMDWVWHLPSGLVNTRQRNETWEEAAERYCKEQPGEQTRKGYCARTVGK